jgi:hypothetical protein
MEDNQALLVVERGPIPALRFALTSDQTTIGRSAGNELVLAEPEVSRRHARVVRRADGFAIEDIGSTNGTFVNGQRITHLTLLQDGDTIDLGDTVRLRFLAPATPTIQPVAVAQPAAIEKPPVIQQPEPQPKPQPADAVFDVVVASWAEDAASINLPPVPTAPERKRGRVWLLGCGLPIALLLVCAGTFLILDAFDQGRLLYCGALGPFFEVILGPFGFAPVCP